MIRGCKGKLSVGNHAVAEGSVAILGDKRTLASIARHVIDIEAVLACRRARELVLSSPWGKIGRCNTFGTRLPSDMVN